MLEHMLDHVEGYEAVTRVGACLDSAGFQISGCAFKHGDALCMGVACVAAERADGQSVTFVPMAAANPSANPAEHEEPRGAPVVCEPVASMPRAGEFIIAVWEGAWGNPKLRLKFYHATAHHSGPVWGAAYRTEEGEDYEIAGWLPLPKLSVE